MMTEGVGKRTQKVHMGRSHVSVQTRTTHPIGTRVYIRSGYFRHGRKGTVVGPEVYAHVDSSTEWWVPILWDDPHERLTFIEGGHLNSVYEMREFIEGFN